MKVFFALLFILKSSLQMEIIGSDEDRLTWTFKGDMATKNARSVETSVLWPSGYVPFIIDQFAGFDYYDLQIIRESAAELTFDTGTCIVFHQIDQPPPFGDPYVLITRSGGCWAALGMIGRPSMQKVSLDGDCLSSHKFVKHQLLHALGVLHEHQRRDRDRYVSIRWSNIYPGYETGFDIDWNGDVFTPYDYESIMHYPSHAYSLNGFATITRRDNGDNRRLGSAFDTTFDDIAKVKAAYRCYW